MKIKSLPIFLITFFASAPCFASVVSSKSRSYTHSCSYFSTAHADLRITYKNDALPWGVKIELIGGSEGTRANGAEQESFTWHNRHKAMIMPAVAPYQWQAELSLLVTERSSPEYVKGYDFYFQITYPDGTVEIDKGAEEEINKGYYRVFFDESKRDCVDGLDGKKPNFHSTKVEIFKG